MAYLEDILVPIFVCVVLPVSIVLITSLVRINSEKQHAKIVIKAIEANKDVDTDKLIESMRKPKKTALEILNLRLLRGCIFSLLGIVFLISGLVDLFVIGDSVFYISAGAFLSIGISYLIVYFVTRKQVQTDSNEEQ